MTDSEAIIRRRAEAAVDSVGRMLDDLAQRRAEGAEAGEAGRRLHQPPAPVSAPQRAQARPFEYRNWPAEQKFFGAICDRKIDAESRALTGAIGQVIAREREAHRAALKAAVDMADAENAALRTELGKVRAELQVVRAEMAALRSQAERQGALALERRNHRGELLVLEGALAASRAEAAALRAEAAAERGGVLVEVAA